MIQNGVGITKVPDNKYKVPDFKVVIKEDSDEPQTWRVFNDTSFIFCSCYYLWNFVSSF